VVAAPDYSRAFGAVLERLQFPDGKDLRKHPMSDMPQQEREDAADESFGMPERAHPAGNLPLQLTSFVGRERELAETIGLLSTERLLTLTGPGGSGKTRLALAVASEVAQNVEDGVWLVELASLSDQDLLPQAVASVVGVRESPGTTLADTLAEHLETRNLLLILDNCEHLVEACASLAATLLRSCPDLHILATSREGLGVPGEILLGVPPLSLPDPRHLPAADGLSGYEAARLFAERARAVRPDFSLTEGNAMAVAQVCYRLDGIPLAIELAAARARVLSVEQISSRLDESFGLLTAGSRRQIPRHRTLRATMDWSYELLSGEEQILFRRLSVFAGGWTLEAAEEVCAGEGVEQSEVLDLLASLVDKSLVLVSEQDGEARYRLLETVRQYASEKLEESGEAEEVRSRHAAWFVALAEEAGSHLKGHRQEAWLGRLDTEHDNLRVTLSWVLERGNAELGLGLAGSLGEFWFLRGYLEEGRRWLEAALANGEAPESARARPLGRAAWIAWEQSDYERSVALSEECVALSRKLGDETEIAFALYALGMAELNRNELERARALLEEAATLERASGDTADVARVLSVLGLVAVVSHDYEGAITLHREGLELARSAEDELAIGLSLRMGALAYSARGDHRRANALSEEGLERSRRQRALHQVGHHLHVAAVLAGAQGLAARSARLWGAAEALREAIGAGLVPVESYYYGPYIAAARAQLGEPSWTTAWAEGRAMTPEQAVEYALDQSQDPAETESPTYPAGLSVREAEVLKLVAQGMTNAQIAEKLYISPRTVNAHMGSVYHKIGSHSRAEAARFASEHDLL
jgi:predicted ATPase/DNA-binding NarL/FixJ family response regulator